MIKIIKENLIDDTDIFFLHFNISIIIKNITTNANKRICIISFI
jgi:hypothetical protein